MLVIITNVSPKIFVYSLSHGRYLKKKNNAVLLVSYVSTNFSEKFWVQKFDKAWEIIEICKKELQLMFDANYKNYIFTIKKRDKLILVSVHNPYTLKSL